MKTSSERKEKKGCYASNPAPEGCMRVTIVEPGAGLEVGFGGTLRAHVENGVKNGLLCTVWVFEGATSGALQGEFPMGNSATLTSSGAIKMVGFNNIALLQWK